MNSQLTIYLTNCAFYATNKTTPLISQLMIILGFKSSDDQTFGLFSVETKHSLLINYGLLIGQQLCVIQLMPAISEGRLVDISFKMYAFYLKTANKSDCENATSVSRGSIFIRLNVNSVYFYAEPTVSHNTVRHPRRRLNVVIKINNQNCALLGHASDKRRLAISIQFS